MLGWMHASYNSGIELPFYISLIITAGAVVCIVVFLFSQFLKTLFGNKM